MATRDSLPDITKKANAAFSHRWRVISNPRITSLFFVSITGLFFITSLLAHHSRIYVSVTLITKTWKVWRIFGNASMYVIN